MVFTPETKNPGDLVKSKDWNEAMQAIVDLIAKFDAAVGHSHSGAPEDAPLIQASGIADGAIATAKLQDGAVTSNKLASNAVSGTAIQNNAISTSKIQDGAIAAAKIAPGVVPRDISIAVSPALQNGQTIPPPNGFNATECVFFAFFKSFTVPAGGGTFTCFANAQGQISANPANSTVVGVAIAKRGGW